MWRTNRSAEFYSDSVHSYYKTFSTFWFIFSSLNMSPWVTVLLLSRLLHQRKNMGLATDSSCLFQLKIIFPSRFELQWEQMDSRPINGLLLHLLSYIAQWIHEYFNLKFLGNIWTLSTCQWRCCYMGDIQFW